MTHLKYKCKVNFVKLPLIWIDLCLKLVFENATTGRNTGCHSVVNCMSSSLQLPLTVSDAVCGIQNATKQCISHYHLHTVNQFFHPSPYTISLETWLANCGDRYVRSIAQGNDSSGNFWLHVKNEEELRHDGNTYDLIFFKGISSKSRGNSSCRNLRYASPVRQPSKMKGPISWSSRTAHHTLTLKHSWKLLSTVAWGFSSAQTWELCVLLRPSRLNSTSSVNRM